MIFLLNFCDFPWWIAWLLPFLLGLLIGWLLWARYRALYADRGRELDTLRKRISELENDLEDCRRANIDAKGQIAALETKLRRAEKALEAGANSGNIQSGDLSGVVTGTTTGPVDEEDDGGDQTDSGSERDTYESTDVAVGAGAGSNSDIYAGLPNDNLQIIEGIGPKMESVIKENDISTWAALASKTSNELRQILAKYGDRYTRIIDPETWPEQASLARDGKWEALIARQKELDTGRAGGSSSTDSKLEKIMIKLGLLRKYKQDDLKAVEGIGPKIEGLLHDAGIDTWSTLSQTSVHRIQEILNAAGPRYKLADPKTWPKQAELAAAGKFRELQTYQDELTGGR